MATSFVLASLLPHLMQPLSFIIFHSLYKITSNTLVLYVRLHQWLFSAPEKRALNHRFIDRFDIAGSYNQEIHGLDG